MTIFVGDCCDKLQVVKHEDIDDDNEYHDGVYQVMDIVHNNHRVFIRNRTQSDKFYIYYDMGQGWVLGPSLTNNNLTGSSSIAASFLN